MVEHQPGFLQRQNISFPCLSPCILLQFSYFLFQGILNGELMFSSSFPLPTKDNSDINKSLAILALRKWYSTYTTNHRKDCCLVGIFAKERSFNSFLNLALRFDPNSALWAFKVGVFYKDYAYLSKILISFKIFLSIWSRIYVSASLALNSHERLL